MVQGMTVQGWKCDSWLEYMIGILKTIKNWVVCEEL